MSELNIFNHVLSAALSPITLISGVGLIMICMTGRYNHATNRIRQLMAKRSTSARAFEPDLDDEIKLIFQRASLLRKGMLCVALSAVCSALLVAMSAINSIAGMNLFALEIFLLMSAVSLIVASSLLFSAEIGLSLKALKLAVYHLPKTNLSNKTEE